MNGSLKNTLLCVCIVFMPLIYYYGRSHSTVERVIETVSVPVPEPVEVYLPSPDEADLPVINDTIITGDVIVVSTKVDTAAIINDWISRRVYRPTLWDDDKKGKLELSFAVQYNTLTGLDYTYTPPNIRKKKWSVGVSVGPVVTPSGITGGVMLGIMYDLWQF